MMSLRHSITFSLLLAASLLTGCDRHDSSPPSTNRDTTSSAPSDHSPLGSSSAYAASTSGNDVKLSIQVSQTHLSVADRLVLRLDLTWPSVEPPQWPESLSSVSGLRLVDIKDSGPAAVASASGSPAFVFSRRLTFEPLLPGTKTIPKINVPVAHRSSRPSGNSDFASVPDRDAVLTLDPIVITVESLMPDAPEDAQALTKLLLEPSNRGFMAAPEIQRKAGSISRISIVAFSAILLGAIGSGIAAYIRKSRRPPKVDPTASLKIAIDLLTAQADADTIDPQALATINRLLRSVLARLFDSTAKIESWSDSELLSNLESLSRVQFSSIREHLSALLRGLEQLRFAPDSSNRSELARSSLVHLQLLAECLRESESAVHSEGGRA